MNQQTISLTKLNSSAQYLLLSTIFKKYIERIRRKYYKGELFTTNYDEVDDEKETEQKKTGV